MQYLKKNLFQGTLLAAGMFALTYNGYLYVLAHAPWGQVLACTPLGGQVWAPLKLSCVHFSLCLQIPNFLEVPETHRETSIDHLGGVDTTMGRAPAPKIQAKLSKYMGEGEVSISASIRVPCTKFCLEGPETHKYTSRPLGKCQHTC